jgi:hypothetical protein
MRTRLTALGAIGPLLALLLAAGCGGGGQTSSVVPQSPADAVALSTATRAQCRSVHGVSVAPCPVRLNHKNNGEQNVTITAPPGSTISENDNCDGIAIIQFVSSTWMVLSNDNDGQCRAIFSATVGGKKAGYAVLPIVNRI